MQSFSPFMLKDLGNFVGNRLQNLFCVQITDSVISNLIKDICTQLLQNNVNPKYVFELRKNLNQKINNQISNQTNKNKIKIIQQTVFDCLSELIDPQVSPYKISKGEQHVIVFVGLQGSGKTTSICKYARFYRSKGFKVGIVCADTFRAGAYDQIKQNANKINVAYWGNQDEDNTEVDPVSIARKGVSHFKRHDYELILVDTSGRHVQSEDLFLEIQNLVTSINPNNIIFVIDAGIGQSAEDQVQGFKKAINIGGIILTKIDGAEKAGGALSSIAVTKCPVEFIGTGEKMEDFERFNSKIFISKLLGIPNFEGMLEQIVDLDLNPDEISSKLAQGRFTLGDFRHFYNQICTLGPITNLLKITPGMNKFVIPDETKLKKIGSIFNSMCKAELNSIGDIFNKEPNRMIRIARGSGTSKEQVSELLHNFKSMSLMAKKIMNMPGIGEMFKNSGDIDKHGAFSGDNMFKEFKNLFNNFQF